MHLIHKFRAFHTTANFVPDYADVKNECVKEHKEHKEHVPFSLFNVNHLIKARGLTFPSPLFSKQSES